MNLNLNEVPSLLNESTFENTIYDRNDLKRRREILNETVSSIILNADFFYKQAKANLEKWFKKGTIEREKSIKKAIVEVFAEIGVKSPKN